MFTKSITFSSAGFPAMEWKTPAKSPLESIRYPRDDQLGFSSFTIPS